MAFTIQAGCAAELVTDQGHGSGCSSKLAAFSWASQLPDDGQRGGPNVVRTTGSCLIEMEPLLGRATEDRGGKAALS